MNYWILMVAFAATITSLILAKTVGDEKPTIYSTEKSVVNTWPDITQTTRSSTEKELYETASEETTKDKTTLNNKEKSASTSMLLRNEDQENESEYQQFDSEEDEDYYFNTQEIQNGVEITNTENADDVKLNGVLDKATSSKINLAVTMFKIFIMNEVYGNKSSSSKTSVGNRAKLALDQPPTSLNNETKSNLNNEDALDTVASNHFTEMGVKEDVDKKLAEATLFDYQLFAKFYLQQLYECATADEINVNWADSASGVLHKI